MTCLTSTTHISHHCHLCNSTYRYDIFTPVWKKNMCVRQMYRHTHYFYFWKVVPLFNVGRDSSVGIATRYRLDGRGSNPWRTQRPRGLRRRAVAGRPLGLRVRIPTRTWMFVLCVVSKETKVKSRTLKKKKQVRMKYRVQENIKKIPVGARFSAPVQAITGAHPASYTIGTGLLHGGKAAGAWR